MGPAQCACAQPSSRLSAEEEAGCLPPGLLRETPNPLFSSSPLKAAPLMGTIAALGWQPAPGAGSCRWGSHANPGRAGVPDSFNPFRGDSPGRNRAGDHPAPKRAFSPPASSGEDSYTSPNPGCPCRASPHLAAAALQAQSPGCFPLASCPPRYQRDRPHTGTERTEIKPRC